MDIYIEDNILAMVIQITMTQHTMIYDDSIHIGDGNEKI